jgi:hypothetical protein
MATPRDRTAAILASTTFNGIDFVTVDAVDPRTLYVHFMNAVSVADPALAASITGGDSVPIIPVAAIDGATDWGTDAEGRPLLTLHAAVDGDFSNYILTLTGSEAIDLIFSISQFSFKANCPDDFDCAPPPVICPPDETPVPPIDYLAKDFLSFRQALLDDAALRYPEWRERSEADFGVIFAEALSAVGDELSYLQDRVAAEAALETATQRRSLVSLARLVDYEPRPATSATTLLQLDVSGPAALAPGAQVFAPTPDGGRAPFEIGAGLNDQTTYAVSDVWNFGIQPYWFDDEEQCWPQGATDLWVQGHGYGFTTGQALLIQTDLPGESLRQVVHLTVPGAETTDPLFGPTPVTHISWGTDEALPRGLDLTKTQLGGNVVPATQGARVSETFAVGSPPAATPDARLAIARWGPNADDDAPNWIFRYPLGQSPLAWLAAAGDPSAAPTPEIILGQTLPTPRTWAFAPGGLLNSQATDLDFAIDPVAWRAVGFTNTGRPNQYDIDGDGGDTLRFGDDVFGAAPSDQDLFQVTYRVGAGAAGNVAADTITQVDPASAGVIVAARNPFPVTDGADAESATHIVRSAPQAFRAVQFRAVRPEDYEAAAETLPWVQKAGTALRWTGSWATVFTAVDPKGAEQIALDQELALVELLNRRRLAGYESYAPNPIYLSVDLQIEVCAQDGWLDSDVEAGVLDTLGSATRPGDDEGFFFADRFSFGSPLYRSRLEAAIQAVPGVAGVRSVVYRRRGGFSGFVDLSETVTPAPNQILRVDNDPSWPERGVIKVIVEGGR